MKNTAYATDGTTSSEPDSETVTADTVTIVGKKYIDNDGNGEASEGDTLGVGWTIKICRYEYVDDTRVQVCNSFATTITDENGEYVFNQLPRGVYKVEEVNQDYFTQTSPELGYCSIDFTQNFNLYSEERILIDDIVINDQRECNFFNQPIEPQLYITKENNTGGATKSIGDEVLFTITLWAEESPVTNILVTDLMSEGFTYVSGSAKIDGVVFTPQPSYASPGTWDLGSRVLEPGDDPIVLTYLATIDDGVEPGEYKDIAWAVGEDTWEGKIYATADDPGDLDTGDSESNFVGTEVKIAVDPEPLNTDVDVKEEEIEGEVLGASTLPATGASTFWVNLMLVIASIGGLLLLIGGFGTMKKDKKETIKKGKKALLGLLAVGFVALLGSKAYAAGTVVRLSEPESNVNDEFDLVFVAMDINDSARELTAKCFVQKPGEVIFSSTPFHTEVIPSTEVGDSRICPVTESDLTSEGEYKFLVKVTPEGGSEVSSNTVTVSYDGDGPDKPKYIKKEKVNDCVNKITLRTADDGETSLVRIFADDDKEIDIDDSHKIETETIGPDEKFEFEHIVSGDDCDKTWYYAVVAFDDAGNASKPRAEEITTTTTTTEEEETEAIPVEGGASIVEGGVAGEGATGPEGAEGDEGEEALEVDFGEGEEGSVLGEETSKEGKTLFKSPWFWIVSAGLGIVIISATRKKKA